jgi:hypothetical protein
VYYVRDWVQRIWYVGRQYVVGTIGREVEVRWKVKWGCGYVNLHCSREIISARMTTIRSEMCGDEQGGTSPFLEKKHVMK